MKEKTAETVQNKIQPFLEANRNSLTLVLIIIAAGIAGLYYWQDQKEAKEKQAQLDIYRAQYFFGKDSLELSLAGNGATVMGMREVATTYDGTKAGNLAHFYQGVILMKKGSYQEAIDHLEDFESDDLLLQARAYALIGDAYMELKDIPQAITFYEKASTYKPNSQFTPGYLTKLALAQELAGQQDHALKAYKTILASYPNAPEANAAKKYAAKLAMATKTELE